MWLRKNELSRLFLSCNAASKRHVTFLNALTLCMFNVSNKNYTQNRVTSISVIKYDLSKGCDRNC